MRLRALAALVAFACAVPASARVFHVDAATPDHDAAPGDGACATASARCTGLAALEEAAALAGADEIRLGGTVAMLGSSPAEVRDQLRIVGPGGLAGSLGSVLEVTEAARVHVIDARLDGVLDVRGEMAMTEGSLHARSWPPDVSLVGIGGRLVLEGGTVTGRLGVSGSLVADGTSFVGGGGPGEGTVLVVGGAATLRGCTISGLGSTNFGIDRPPVSVGGRLDLIDCHLDANGSDGLLVGQGGHARVIRSRFTGRSAWALGWGGPVDLDLVQADGRVDMVDCEVSGQHGAGLRVAPTGVVTVDRTSFSGMETAGVSTAGTLVMRDSRIVATRSNDQLWHGVRTDGVGLRVTGGTARLERCTVADNLNDPYGRPVAGAAATGQAMGAGIRVHGGSLVLSDCLVDRNEARGRNGSFGAGLLVTGGAVTLERSLVSRNRVLGDGGGVVVTGGSLTVVDGTISGNRASQGTWWNGWQDVVFGGHGGGVLVRSPGSVRLLSATLAGNVADAAAGGIDVAIDAEASAGDGLLADNLPDDCRGTLVSEGWLLLEAGDACTVAGSSMGLIIGADPSLGPLASNGGLHDTHALLDGSVARDAASPGGNRDADGSVLAVDQRGSVRIADGDGDGTARGDLGAHEACSDPMDSDADGRGDSCDGCPLVADGGSDADADGLGDACDPGDADGDTLPDSSDPSPAVPDAVEADTDGDGLGDSRDPCPLDPVATGDADGDGVGDACDTCPGTPDVAQFDLDDDGLGDPCDPCPLAAQAGVDGDRDGLDDACDACPGVADPGQEDGDHDGLGDACDACPSDRTNDADGDGICGMVDNCPDIANAGQDDADLDGRGDACDPCPEDRLDDVDADATCGSVDNCPTVANPAQEDADGDAFGDACDACPDVADPMQRDFDQDGAGDACDPCPRDARDDVDEDGWCADLDNCPGAANADQADADADGDGDACDACPDDPSNDADGDAACGAVDNCDDVRNPDQADVDGDGVGDACDRCPDTPDPAQRDVDADGRADACDACPGVRDPDQGDWDGDGLGDACDPCPSGPIATGPDQDGDGTKDWCDGCPMVADPLQEDADRDAVGDACDLCPADPLNDVDVDGRCLDDDNCPWDTNPDQVDADGDGTGDACDPDLCVEPLDLRVSKEPSGRLRLSFTLARGVADAYGGLLEDARRRAPSRMACSLEAGELVVSPSSWDEYFVVGVRCGSLRTPHARDSSGAPWPEPSWPCP